MNGFRRVLTGAVIAAAAPAVMAMPVAGAHPDVCGTATSGINGYLDRNPDVNQALIDLANENPGQVGDAYSTYFDNHPDVANELRSFKGPLNDLNCVNSLPFQVVDALAAL